MNVCYYGDYFKVYIFEQTLVPSNPIIAFLLFASFINNPNKYLNKLSACLELNFAYY